MIFHSKFIAIFDLQSQHAVSNGGIELRYLTGPGGVFLMEETDIYQMLLFLPEVIAGQRFSAYV